MNILVLPTTDWIRHPVPSRHHFVFERLGKNHSVFVWHFDAYKNRPISRTANNLQLIEPTTISAGDLAQFYTLNAPVQSMEILRTIKKHKIDVVFNAQLVHGLTSNVLSRFGGLTTVFDLSDYFPQSASVYYANNTNFLRSVMETTVLGLTRVNLLSSSLCIAPTLPLVKLISNLTSGRKKAHLLTNGVDTQHFKPLEFNRELAEKYGIKENAIGFVGSIEPWLDLETVLKGLVKLKREIPDVQLVLVGCNIRTAYFKSIQQMVIDYGLADNVVEVGRVPYETIPLYLSLVKCCIIPFRNDLFMSNIALPNKYFEYLACGKPMLSTRLPEIERVGSGIVWFYEDPDSFCDQAKKILRENAIFALEVAMENAKFAKEYDWDNIAKKLEELIMQTRNLPSIVNK